MHPEDAIEGLEAGLRGAELSGDVIRRRISSALEGVRCFGFDEESLAGAILEAVRHEV